MTLNNTELTEKIAELQLIIAEQGRKLYELETTVHHQSNPYGLDYAE